MSEDDDKTVERGHLQITLEDPNALRSLIDTISEGTYVASPDGRIVDANSAFLQMLGRRQHRGPGEPLR